MLTPWTAHRKELQGRSRRRHMGALVLLASCGLLLSANVSRVLAAATPTPAPLATPAEAAPTLSAASASLFAAINRSRAAHHLPALTLSKRQSVCSRKHSVHMAAMGEISHDQFPSDVCVAHGWAGENVGVAYGDPVQAVLTLHTMMMGEGPCPDKGCPGDEMETHGHYMNLLNRHFTHVGIGLVQQDDALWLTENFTD